jgi:hypothetical protein
MSEQLTDEEKKALSLAAQFRIPQLARVRDNLGQEEDFRNDADRQINALVSAAQKLELP